MGALMSSGPRLAAGWFFFFLLCSGAAQALIIDLEFVDETLVSNQSVEFDAEYLGCPAPSLNVDGIQSEVRRDGSVIDFYYSVDDGPCGVPPPGPTLTYTLGLLPEGQYTLRYAPIVRTVPFPPSMNGLDPEEVQFSVGEPVFVPIPVLSGWALAALGLLLGGLAVYRIRG